MAGLLHPAPSDLDFLSGKPQSMPVPHRQSSSPDMASRSSDGRVRVQLLLPQGRRGPGEHYLGASMFLASFFLVSSIPVLHCVCMGPSVAHLVKEAIASAKWLVASCAKPSKK
jgi:hypothetical protein